MHNSLHSTGQKDPASMSDDLRVVAWEITRRCPMSCQHCRAGACEQEYQDELTTAEATTLIDDLAELLPKNGILILTGGEPMTRPDIYQLAKHAHKSGLTVVMAPCGELINQATIEKIIAADIAAISLSIDGIDAETHDRFRGVNGAFATIIAAAKLAKKNGLAFQINTTVSKRNLHQLEDIYQLAVDLGAKTQDFFFLVPTGRGKNIADLVINNDEYEEALERIYKLSLNSPIGVKTTCAPQYSKVQRQHAGADFAKIPPRFRARGCLGGKGFIFISHQGVVQPCGFLDLECGNIRKNSIGDIYNHSEIFNNLRDHSKYEGKCGECNFVKVCGGCRARAFEQEGNYLADIECEVSDVRR